MVDYRDCHVKALSIISELFKKYKDLNYSLNPNDINTLSNEVSVKLLVGEPIDRVKLYARDYLIYKACLIYRENPIKDENSLLYYILECIVLDKIGILGLQKEAFNIDDIINDILDNYDNSVSIEQIVSDYVSKFSYRKNNRLN